MRTRLAIAFVLLGVMSLPSCNRSGKLPEYPVTGSVTLAGKPIEKGSIVFDPADGQGTAAMGGIENGQFTAQVPPGEKILRISAVRQTNEKDQYGSLITESYVPTKYNIESQIKKTVSADQENKFDIVLE